jgi:hypothetical protein
MIRTWLGRTIEEKEDGATREKVSRADVEKGVESRRGKRCRKVIRKRRRGQHKVLSIVVFFVRVETARENGQECNGGLHESVGGLWAFMEIGRRPSQAEAARDCHGRRK